ARAAAKYAALAYTRLQQRQDAAAVVMADQALAASQSPKIQFLAGRVYVAAGKADRAQPLAEALGAEMQGEPQAFGQLLEGELALQRGDAREAIRRFSQANALVDTWIGHFNLGRAYLEAGAYPQADSELDRCIKRRGEALSLFLDEEQTYGWM